MRVSINKRFDKKLLSDPAILKAIEIANNQTTALIEKPLKCSVSWCNNDHLTRYLCANHYSVLRHAKKLKPLPKPIGKCSSDTCPRNAAVKGMCTSHYRLTMHHAFPEDKATHHQSRKNNPAYREARNASHRKYSQSNKGRFAYSKNKAKRRGIEWILTLNDYCSIVSPVCHYGCGSPTSIYGVGLDRKDSSKGYTKENSVSCCWNCNKLKNDLLSEKEALKTIAMLVEERGTDIWAEK